MITRNLSALFIVLYLGGCGLSVPQMADIYQNPRDEKQFENIIVQNVKCELHRGVQNTFDYFGADPGIAWLRGWGATVNLKLTVDEKSTLTPGLSLNRVFANAVTFFPAGGDVTTAQGSGVGLGVQASADATRTETIAVTYAFQDLLAEGRIDGPCDHEDGVLIQSDLKIAEFIFNKAFIATVPGSTGNTPYSVFNEEITFVVSYGASATPTWQFLKVTIDTSSPLFNATRTKTHDLTITLGPASPATQARPAQIARQAQDVHLAALIGQSVATAIQTQTHR
jgi:hypothetical protein